MNARASTAPASGAGSDAASAALEYAREVHSGQRRKQTGEPFVEHPVAVAKLLAGSAAGADDALFAAAYLHDAVEKTPVEAGDVAERFGPGIAATVVALTDDDSISDYGERKRALRAQVLASSRDAVLIYAADRLANIRDWLSLDPEERPACAERLGTSLGERLGLWREDLEELTAYDPGLPFLGEIELGLRALGADAGESADAA